MVSMKRKCEIFPRVSNADGARTTAREPHPAITETPILGPTHRALAPKVEVLRLTNMILVHENAAIVHKVGGVHENIIIIMLVH